MPSKKVNDESSPAVPPWPSVALRVEPNASDDDLLRAKVEELAAQGCTLAEIASVLNRGVAYVKDQYGAEVIRGRDLLRIAVRRKLLQSSEEKPTVLIWLARHYLGQYDEEEVPAPKDIEKPLNEMTTSEMLEAFTKGARD